MHCTNSNAKQSKRRSSFGKESNTHGTHFNKQDTAYEILTQCNLFVSEWKQMGTEFLGLLTLYHVV